WGHVRATCLPSSRSTRLTLATRISVLRPSMPPSAVAPPKRSPPLWPQGGDDDGFWAFLGSLPPEGRRGGKRDLPFRGRPFARPGREPNAAPFAADRRAGARAWDLGTRGVDRR